MSWLPRARPALDAPLDPSPPEGRSWLRRELLAPEYQETDLVRRLLAWVAELLSDGVAVAGRTPPLSLFASMLVLLLLVLAVGWLLGRTGRTTRRRGVGEPAVVDPRLTAADLRTRAEEAYAQGHYGEAVVDAFRATATRESERGRLEDLPGRTALEVATSLVASHPSRAELIMEVARSFDLVRYGERPAGHEQADAALALDDALQGRRVRTW